MENKNYKILLVDDEEGAREVYSNFLEHMVHLVFTAKGGVEALEVLKEEQGIDILITDLHMPEMDGIELIKIVRKKYPNILTLILTGHRDVESVSSAISLGVFDFLEKPIMLDLFQYRVRKALLEVSHLRKRNRILEYLLDVTLNYSMDDFYKMTDEKRGRVLDFVQGIIEARVIKKEVRRE